MKKYGDFHVHSTYCDGKSTLRETVVEALYRNLPALGFSGHGYTPFPSSYCMTKAGQEAYKKEVRALAQEYRDRLPIFLGIEQDLLGGPLPDRDDYDYVIGSVHYWVRGSERFDVDGPLDRVQETVDRLFGGDFIAAAEEYYENVAKIGILRPSVVGHFDLITKHNEGYRLFDEEDPRYVRAARRCIDALLPLGIPFEINTGAMSRGYRTSPYPAPHLREYILEKGGRFVINGDTHDAQNLCFAFDEWLPRLEAQPDEFWPR